MSFYKLTYKMNKISISTLVPEAGLKTNMHSKPLDINTLMASTKGINDSYTADMIIKSREKKRERILEIYSRCYDQCIEKIKLLNTSNKIDLVYNIPIFIPDCPDYNPQRCLEYIETKLRVNCFDTLRLSDHSIFVTWKYIELNKVKYG
jgi:hypothetical protein